MPETTAKPLHRYLELDALRGIAALMVVLFHYTLRRDDYNDILKLGTTGVDLFFIISGFVIFMSLQNIQNGKQFAVNRFARLYPTYWAAVTFTFVLMAAVSIYNGRSFLAGDNIWRYIANLTMFQFYLGQPDLDSPYWTLLLEMLFYIFMLLVYKFRLLKHINAIGLTISITTVVAAQFFYHVPVVKTVIVYVPLLQFMPLFLMGISFYKIYISNERNISQYIIPIVCLICQILLFRYAGRSKHFIHHQEYAAMLTLFFIFFCAFVNGLLGFIVNKYTLFLGRISYAVYVVHQYVSLKVIFPVFLEKLGLNFWITSLFIALPAVILIATAITYFIEVPFRYRLKKALSPVFVPKEENQPLC
jgi:peptidoglycan/LPS O-acetylase OafA/YrhL